MMKRILLILTAVVAAGMLVALLTWHGNSDCTDDPTVRGPRNCYYNVTPWEKAQYGEIH